MSGISCGQDGAGPILKTWPSAEGFFTTVQSRVKSFSARGLVSKETVVLRRWEVKQKILDLSTELIR